MPANGACQVGFCLLRMNEGGVGGPHRWYLGLGAMCTPRLWQVQEVMCSAAAALSCQLLLLFCARCLYCLQPAGRTEQPPGCW
jgi:hypothetical protein